MPKVGLPRVVRIRCWPPPAATATWTRTPSQRRNIALTSTGRGDLIKELIPLRREEKPGFGGMDFPKGPLIERDLTSEELREELRK